MLMPNWRPIAAVVLSAALLSLPARAADNTVAFDFITHNEIQIAASPAAVWPHLRNVNAWKMGAKTTLAGGAKDMVGERFAAAPEGAVAVSYYIETVELAPGSRWTIRLNTPEGGLMGYAMWTLSAAGEGTLLRYDTFLRSTAPGVSGAAAQIAARTNEEASQRMDTEFGRLKRLVETDHKK